jgi:signal transduction histidine kinase
VTSLDELLRQARRLRFADAVLEQRYRDNWQAEAVQRGRVTMGVAIVFVAVAGWLNSLSKLDYVEASMAWTVHYRFFIMVPWWALGILSSFLPGHVRRAEWVNAAVTVGVLWGVTLKSLGYPKAYGALGSVMSLDFFLIFASSVLVLSMRLRVLVMVAGAGTVGAMAAVRVLMPEAATLAGLVAINFPLIAAVVVALGWGRERTQRTLFAQQEHMRQLAAQLEEKNAELARLSGEQAEFMTIAAHDLRAPLATVRGYAALLRGGKLRDGEAQAKALGEIEGQSTRMLSLVNDYLGTHAAEGMARVARRERIDLAAAARAAAARHGAAAAEKRQTLRVSEAASGRKGEPESGRAAARDAVWAMGDADLLAQVVDNFVTNAVKFSPMGTEVRIEAGAATTASGGPEWVRLAVVDAGPGIAAEEQAGLFKKFGRASTKPTAGEASHGLGLAVAKRLAEAMGGSVGCQSPVHAGGTGTRFWVELPAGAEDRANAER